MSAAKNAAHLTEPVTFAVNRLTRLLREMDDASRDAEAEWCREVLDQLVGFCSPDMRLVAARPRRARLRRLLARCWPPQRWRFVAWTAFAVWCTVDAIADGPASPLSYALPFFACLYAWWSHEAWADHRARQRASSGAPKDTP